MRPILRPADGPPSARRRATSFALAVAAHVLIALLLFHLAPALSPEPEPASSLETFSIAPGPEEATTRPSRTAAQARTRPNPAAGSPPPAAVTPPPPIPQPVPTPPVDLSLFGDRALANAADLSRIPARGRGGDAEGTDSGRDSVAPYGPGEGPGGQRLYNAEWQGEPTDAELSGYLPNGAPPGAWAMIACRTVEGNQVENCRVLGESPLGSGLGKAMRQAAWQFRVLPPRVGGRKLMGAWVRIKIDFGKAPAE